MTKTYNGAPNAAREARMNHMKDDALHQSNDAFIRATSIKQNKFAGKNPVLKEEGTKYNEYMCNTGEHASDFARKLTAGLDKDSYPVK